MRIVKVKSFTRRVYHVVREIHGKWECSCEFNKYTGKVCDHIRKARHQKMTHHGRQAIRDKKVIKAKALYNKLAKAYKRTEHNNNLELAKNAFTPPHYKLYEKRANKIAVGQAELNQLKKQIQKLLKDYPEIKKTLRRQHNGNK